MRRILAPTLSKQGTHRFRTPLPGLLLSTVLAIAMGSVAPSARAQQPVPGRQSRFRAIRIKLGGYFPIGGSVRDQIGSALLSGGVSYEYPEANDDPVTALYGVYLEGAARSGSVTRDVAGQPTDFDTRFGYFTVGASVRKESPSDPEGSRTYAGLGFGVYFLHEKGVKNENGLNQAYTRNSSSLGGKILAGVDTPGGVFSELDFTYPGYWDRSGFGFSVGLRF
jgi:hypothetical protein